MAVTGQLRKRGRSWQVDVSVNGERARRSVGASKIEVRGILDELHEMPAPRGVRWAVSSCVCEIAGEGLEFAEA